MRYNFIDWFIISEEISFLLWKLFGGNLNERKKPKIVNIKARGCWSFINFMIGFW